MWLQADQLSDIVLAKEEMTWHQTIIRSEDRVEIMNTVDKSKREKKLPTRFRNNVLLGREMCPTGTPSEAAEQETALPEPQPVSGSKTIMDQVVMQILNFVLIPRSHSFSVT